MIRITADSSKGLRLVVQGHLSGTAVDELQKSCTGHDAGTVLDLSGLVFADRCGAVLLNELSAAGFVIEGCSRFMELLLSNAGDSQTPLVSGVCIFNMVNRWSAKTELILVVLVAPRRIRLLLETRQNRLQVPGGRAYDLRLLPTGQTR